MSFCLSVFPQIINSHGAAGPINRDSDLSVVKDTNIRKKGFTHNDVTSARLNIANLLQGNEPVLQHPEDKQSLEGPMRFSVDEAERERGKLYIGTQQDTATLQDRRSHYYTNLKALGGVGLAGRRHRVWRSDWSCADKCMNVRGW